MTKTATKVAHTPGPWIIGEPEKEWGGALPIQADRSYVAHVNNYGQSVLNGNLLAHGCGCDDPMANARLIAAAPDLLNALVVLADAAEARGIPCDAARAAIAKATASENPNALPADEIRRRANKRF